MKFDKIVKTLGDSVLEELNEKSAPDLERQVALSTEAIVKATRERDADPCYQGAKQAVADLSMGLKEVKNFQTAKIQFALLKLRAAGQGDPLTEEEQEDLDRLQAGFKPKGKRDTL